jgi:hypothetical protein
MLFLLFFAPYLYQNMRMPFRHLILLLLACASLCACTKEQSVDTGAPGMAPPMLNVPVGKLARMVYKYGTAGTSATDFLYDATGMWIGFNAPSGDPLIQGYMATRIMRNSDGIITSYTVKDDAANGGAEKTYRVYYDNAQKQYLARAGNVMLNGNLVLDSTVFSYTNGRIVSGNIYIKASGAVAASDYGRVDFGYDNTGNITIIRTSLLNSETSLMEPVTELGMEFDNKPNAMPVGAEAIVLDYIYGANNNNIRKVSSLDVANGIDTVVNLYADYTYRGDNKPQTAEIHSDGKTIQISYVYR